MTPDTLPPQRRPLPRRRVLQIIAASALVPLGVAGIRQFGPQPQFHEWHGEALGAQASMQLWHSNAGHAQRTLMRMASEVARLERAFSLYRADSEISRLNRDGQIPNPSPDLAIVVEAALRYADASDGAFDPSVQPLWSLNQDHYARPGADPAGPSRRQVDAARRLVDYTRIDLGRSLRLAPGMSLTLNGIAQGYITDVIGDLLRNEGFDHVALELGETRVLGSHPEGRPWRVGLRNPQGGIGPTLDLVNESSATSGGYGTIFSADGRHHHLFDPQTGESSNRLKEVIIVAPNAMDADALATAIYVAGEANAPAILRVVPGARAYLTRLDDSVLTLSA